MASTGLDAVMDPDMSGAYDCNISSQCIPYHTRTRVRVIIAKTANIETPTKACVLRNSAMKRFISLATVGFVKVSTTTGSSSTSAEGVVFLGNLNLGVEFWSPLSATVTAVAANGAAAQPFCRAARGGGGMSSQSTGSGTGGGGGATCLAADDAEDAVAPALGAGFADPMGCGCDALAAVSSPTTGCGGTVWGADSGAVSAAIAGVAGAAGDGPGSGDGGGTPWGVAGDGGTAGGADFGVAPATTAGGAGAAGNVPGGGGGASSGVAGDAGASGDGPGGCALALPATAGVSGTPMYRPCFGAGRPVLYLLCG